MSAFLLGEHVAYKPNEHGATWTTEPYVVEAVTTRISRTYPLSVSYTLLPVGEQVSWAHAKCLVRPEQLRRWGEKPPREEI